VAEYASCGGFDLSRLLEEGRAMLDVLTGSFTGAGHEVRMPPDINHDLKRLSTGCDAGIVVAPDHLLAGFTEVLESGCDNLGSSPDAVRLASDKLLCGLRLRHSGIPTPADVPEDWRWVIKPRFGCGSEDVRLVGSKSILDGNVAETYIEGEHMSTCLMASDSGVLPLSLNRQRIDIDGGFQYTGSTVNVEHPRGTDCMEVARRAVEVIGLRGPCGVDIVLADEPYVVDVNPRMTTSFVGLVPLLAIELAELIVRAHDDDLPDSVGLRGSAHFDLKDLPAVEVRT